MNPQAGSRPLVQAEISRAGVPERDLAYAVVVEYYAAVNVIARDSPEQFFQDYFGPTGGMWLARINGEIVGCVALRPLALPPGAEIKRMYVRPPWRGTGVARQLLAAAESFACQAGYSVIYLDTAADMCAARNLYLHNGYQPCDRYNDNPQAAIYLRKLL